MELDHQVCHGLSTVLNDIKGVDKFYKGPWGNSGDVTGPTESSVEPLGLRLIGIT